MSLILFTLSLCACVLAQAPDLQGSYLSPCQYLQGLPPNHTLRERVEVNYGNFYSISSVFPNVDCSGEAALRYDRIMTGKVGSYIDPSLWTGTGLFAYRNPTYHMTYKHKKKFLTPQTEYGVKLASLFCPSVTFEEDVTTDVMDVTCFGLIFPCASQDYTEESCVTVNPDGSYISCQRNATSGSCTRAEMVYNYFSNGTAPYFMPADPEALTFEDLAGDWEAGCVPLYGMPPGWMVSEESEWHANGMVYLSNTMYSDPDCKHRAFIYYRSYQAYLGEEAVPNPIFGAGARLREMATQYISKYIRTYTSEGVEYLNTLCPLLGWELGVTKNIIDLDCMPFINACQEGDHYEYIKVGLNGTGSLIRYTIDPEEASCSVATYSNFPFLESIEPPVPYLVQLASGSQIGKVSFLVVALISALHLWI